MSKYTISSYLVALGDNNCTLHTISVWGDAFVRLGASKGETEYYKGDTLNIYFFREGGCCVVRVADEHSQLR